MIFKEFPHTGQTFSGLYAAQAWLKENGYSYGSLCGFEPVAIVKGPYNLTQKWRNLTSKERAFVDWQITSKDFRNGAVQIRVRQ